MAKPKAKDPHATVALWQADPTRSVTASIGTALLAGEWRSRDDMDALGVSGSILGQVISVLRQAGYKIERDHMGGGRFRFRVKTGHTPAARRSTRVAREDAGVTHPQLGATLTVRALALDERGDLTVHLSNGHHAWTATITGHVG